MENRVAKALKSVEGHLSNADILTIKYMADKHGTTFDIMVAAILKDWCLDADADIVNRVEAETR